MSETMHHHSARYRTCIVPLLLVLPLMAAAQDAPVSSNLPMPGMASMQAPTDQISAAPANGSMQNMDMHDDAAHGMLLVDQLEYAHGYGGNGPMWEAEAWYGNDNNKLWLRSEGEVSRGRVDDGDIEALWNRPFAAFWSTQLGVRHDLGIGPHRDWAAFGIEGTAPYWVDLEATAYASESGRFAARVRAEYTVRFTQRWFLQPDLEINAYDKEDPMQRIGSGVSDAQLGLRLRYEFSRQFAPYIGVVWTRRFGAAAGFARDDQTPVFDRQFVFGMHIWL